VRDSAFRRCRYQRLLAAEQTTRFTGGSDLFLRKIKSRERKFLFIKLIKNAAAALNSLYFEKFQNHKICFFMTIAKYTQQMLRRF